MFLVFWDGLSCAHDRNSGKNVGRNSPPKCAWPYAAGSKPFAGVFSIKDVTSKWVWCCSFAFWSRALEHVTWTLWFVCMRIRMSQTDEFKLWLRSSWTATVGRDQLCERCGAGFDVSVGKIPDARKMRRSMRREHEKCLKMGLELRKACVLSYIKQCVGSG